MITMDEVVRENPHLSNILQAESTFSLRIRIGEINVLVKSNAIELLRRLEAEKYPGFKNKGAPDAIVELFCEKDLFLGDYSKIHFYCKESFATVLGPDLIGEYDAESIKTRAIVAADPAPANSVIGFTVAAASIALDSFVVHGAALAKGGKGYMFLAKSDGGKSTLAKACANDGIALTDEMAILHKKRGRFWVSGTPFRGEFPVAENMSVPVGGVYFLHKSPTNSHKVKKGSQDSARQILANQIFFPTSRDKYEKSLSFAIDLATSVQCYDLYFNPESDTWRCVQDEAG